MTNAEARNRYYAIKQIIESLPSNKTATKNTDRDYLASGYVPESYQAILAEKMAKMSKDNEPLSFVELSSLSTFFAIHPEKIAGEEKTSSSLFFPIKVVGTKEQVIQTLKRGVLSQKLKRLKNKLQP